MDSYDLIARALAAAFLGGDLEVDPFVERGTRLLGRRWRWLRPLARRLNAAFAGPVRARQIRVAKFILADNGFRRACERYNLEIRAPLAAPPAMCPLAAAERWSVPHLRSADELAKWLKITIPELEWMADLRSLELKQSQGRLRHYHYRTLTKRFGQVRLVEAPKPRLKQVQRRILTGILEHIPPHAAAHGFRRGRSILTFAAPHARRHLVLKIDLQDFFPSIRIARVQALFRTAGYPEEVADLLAGLCTNAAPLDVWSDATSQPACQIREARWRYSQPHLPQGAPSSPALANLCAYRMDCRLAGLAQSAGATYTRYADDLAFSGDRRFARMAKRFHVHACATAMEEGFSIHHRKTRIMRQPVRQQLAGIVVNERLNVRRDDFDRLKATLHNCVRFGPESQDRSDEGDFRARLDGQISFFEMVNPARGSRLRSIFDRIVWPEEAAANE